MTASQTQPARDSLSDLIDSLVSHLNDEAQALQQTLSCTITVRESLIANDRSALEQAIAGQQQCLTGMEAIAASRQILQRALGNRLNIAPDAVTLTRLAQLASPVSARRIRESQTQLRDLAERVESMSRSNAFLIRHAHDLIDRTLDHLCGTGTQTYTADGRPQSGSRGPILQSGW